MKISGILLIFLVMVTDFGQNRMPITVGVFADCQYCDCEIRGSRFYRTSLEKLEECIRYFNGKGQMDFIVNMGDLIDRRFDSFIPVNKILGKSQKPIINLPGNHDLEVEEEYRSKVPDKLGLSKMFHSFVLEEWMFIFTNGNDISFLSEDQSKVNKAKAMTAKLGEEGKPNYHEWNGGFDKEQMEWIEKQLKKAKRQNLKAAVFCHYPVLPLEAHTLWNYEEVLNLLRKYNCVKLWMNGHNHAGNYSRYKGIHFVTLKGMVETESQNAFAEVIFRDTCIEINGFGREESRRLQFD